MNRSLSLPDRSAMRRVVRRIGVRRQRRGPRVVLPMMGLSGSLVVMSTAIHHCDDGPHGTGLLPHDLTAEELAAAPAIDDLDALVIEDLTDEEYEAFLDAITS